MPGRHTPPQREALNAAIGQRVRAAREAAGVSQGAIAERLGFESNSALSRIETGKQTAQPDQLWAIAELCQVDVSELFPERTWKIRGDREESKSTQDRPMLRLVRSASEVPTTLEPGQRRPTGLEGWLARRQILTERELWNLERWVAQDALRPEDPTYWDDVLELVRKRIASRSGGDRGTPRGSPPGSR